MQNGKLSGRGQNLRPLNKFLLLKYLMKYSSRLISLFPQEKRKKKMKSSLLMKI
jgi:hypothetical protein